MSFSVVGNEDIVHTRIVSKAPINKLLTAAGVLSATIQTGNFWKETKKHKAQKANNLDDEKPAKKAKDIIEFAKSWVNTKWKYNFILNNCEHFANWCRYNEKKSLQVEVSIVSCCIPVNVYL